MVSLAMAPLDMTLEEWARLYEDEPGKLVEGRLVEEEVPDLAHESVVSWLIRVLGTWLIRQGGFVFGSEAKFEVIVAMERRLALLCVTQADARLSAHERHQLLG